MKKVTEFLKSVVLTTAGIISLLTVVYLGAVGFLIAVITDKIFQALGSQLTVDKILAQFENAYHTRYEEYRQSLDKLSFRNLKLPF